LQHRWDHANTIINPQKWQDFPHTILKCPRLASRLGISLEAVNSRIVKHHEINPMLGLRGCRLGITSPDITAMQARAIFEAAINVQAKGLFVLPNIMIPLIGTRNELDHQAEIVR